MRIIRFSITLSISLALIALAIANRQVVTLQFMPSDLAASFGILGVKSLPLFLVVLLGVLIGLFLGFVWEYLREHKYRKALVTKNKKVKMLEQEIKKLKNDNNNEAEQILGLLE